MSKHRDYCPGYEGTLAELANEVSDMTHEARADFFQLLQRRVNEQKRREESLGRPAYAGQLSKVEEALKTASLYERYCWDICKDKTEVIRRE